MGVNKARSMFYEMLNSEEEITMSFNGLSDREATRVALTRLIRDGLKDPLICDEVAKIDIRAGKARTKYLLIGRRLTAPMYFEYESKDLQTGEVKTKQGLLLSHGMQEDITRLRRTLVSMKEAGEVRVDDEGVEQPITDEFIEEAIKGRIHSFANPDYYKPKRVAVKDPALFTTAEK
jgi:hypothetical protein